MSGVGVSRVCVIAFMKASVDVCCSCGRGLLILLYGKMITVITQMEAVYVTHSAPGEDRTSTLLCCANYFDDGCHGHGKSSMLWKYLSARGFFVTHQT